MTNCTILSTLDKRYWKRNLNKWLFFVKEAWGTFKDILECADIPGHVRELKWVLRNQDIL